MFRRLEVNVSSSILAITISSEVDAMCRMRKYFTQYIYPLIRQSELSERVAHSLPGRLCLLELWGKGSTNLTYVVYPLHFRGGERRARTACPLCFGAIGNN